MDTVCIPRFSQQEAAREIILPNPLVTDVFPAVNRDHTHFRRIHMSDRTGVNGLNRTVKGMEDSPTPG